jgi:hypothetical protein
MRSFFPWKICLLAIVSAAGCCCPPCCPQPPYQCAPQPYFQYNAAPYGSSLYGGPCGMPCTPCVSSSPGKDRLKLSGDGNSVVAYDEENGKMFVWQKGQQGWEPVPPFPFQ